MTESLAKWQKKDVNEKTAERVRCLRLPCDIVSDTAVDATFITASREHPVSSNPTFFHLPELHMIDFMKLADFFYTG